VHGLETRGGQRFLRLHRVALALVDIGRVGPDLGLGDLPDRGPDVSVILGKGEQFGTHDGPLGDRAARATTSTVCYWSVTLS
jgi:hypothetical protein